MTEPLNPWKALILLVDLYSVATVAPLRAHHANADGPHAASIQRRHHQERTIETRGRQPNDPHVSLKAVSIRKLDRVSNTPFESRCLPIDSWGAQAPLSVHSAIITSVNARSVCERRIQRPSGESESPRPRRTLPTGRSFVRPVSSSMARTGGNRVVGSSKAG